MSLRALEVGPSSVRVAGLSELSRVPDQTVEASGPSPFVAGASCLVSNSFVGNNDFRRSVEPFKVHGHSLCGPPLRL